MKVTLGLDEANFNGYAYFGLTKDLSEIDDGECEDIRAIDICDYLSVAELSSYLTELSKKVAHGGSLTIGGTDCAILFDNQMVDGVKELNAILFPPNKPAKSGLHSVHHVAQLLSNLGLTIVKKGFRGHSFYIGAIRP